MPGTFCTTVPSFPYFLDLHLYELVLIIIRINKSLPLMQVYFLDQIPIGVILIGKFPIFIQLLPRIVKAGILKSGASEPIANGIIVR